MSKGSGSITPTYDFVTLNSSQNDNFPFLSCRFRFFLQTIENILIYFAYTYSQKLILSGYSSYVIVDFDPIGFYSRIGGRSLVRACCHNGLEYILKEHFYSQAQLCLNKICRKCYVNPIWAGGIHLFPCPFWIRFCKLNCYQKFPNIFGGEN